MNILSNVLIVLALLVSVALILVVVVQKSKGGGLASTFAAANNIMGVRKSTDTLEKMTWSFFGGLALLCVVISTVLFQGQGTNDAMQEGIEKAAQQAAPAAAAPAFGGEAATTPAPVAAPEAPVAAPEAPAAPAETPAPAAN